MKIYKNYLLGFANNQKYIIGSQEIKTTTYNYKLFVINFIISLHIITSKSKSASFKPISKIWKYHFCKQRGVTRYLSYARLIPYAMHTTHLCPAITI